MQIRDLLILDDLNLTYLRGRSKFKLGRPFRIAWNYGRWHRRAVIPVGSDTNGSSIPRLLQSLLPPLNDCLIAGAVHDYFASTPGSGVGPAEAAALAREIKRRGNVPAWRAWALWLGTRAFGWIKWHGDTDSRDIGVVDVTRLDPAREPASYEGG